MSLIKINQAAIEAKQRQERITELKKMLSETDYKMTLDYDKPTEEIRVLRQSWRDEIRQLEEQQ